MQPVRYIGARAKNALRFFIRRWHGYNSEFWQDRWVAEEMFGGMRGGFFVDVGAYDGYIASNTYALEKRFGWNGICIEPNARSFAKLRGWRSCECVQACVAEREGTAEFLEGAGVWGGIVSHYPEGWGRTLGKYLRQRTIYQNAGYRTVTKPTVPLAAVLREHNAPRVIEYLSLDTEGSELAILRGIPFEEYVFLTITVEHNSRAEDKQGIFELLTKHGYERAKESAVDDFYVHPSLSSGLTGLTPASGIGARSTRS